MIRFYFDIVALWINGIVVLKIGLLSFFASALLYVSTDGMETINDLVLEEKGGGKGRKSDNSKSHFQTRKQLETRLIAHTRCEKEKNRKVPFKEGSLS